VMDDHLFHLMEREINTMRLICASRQNLEQALYISQMRYIRESKREEERLRSNLQAIRAQRANRRLDPALFLEAEGRERYERLHRQLVEWEQKVASRSQSLDRLK